MRTKIALLVGLAVVFVASAATAAANNAIRLVWTGTSGGGTTGGSSINPGGGAILTLDVLLDIENTGGTGISAFDISVDYASEIMTATNLVGNTECPLSFPPFSVAGVCTGADIGATGGTIGAGTSFSPLAPGATFGTGVVSRIDGAAGLAGAMFNATGLVLAQIVFNYAGGAHALSPDTSSGSFNSVFDQASNNISQAVQAASRGASIIPEPATALLLGLGLGALGLAGRRRR